MIATDIDDDSLQYSRQNITRNGLSDAITVIKASADSQFSVLSTEPALPFTSIDFTMCNPPFFEDDVTTAEPTADTANKNRTGKRPYPTNASTGIKSELSTGGGEIGFVEQMIRDSGDLKERIKVFTTMLGHKSSLAAVETRLKTNGIWNYSTTEFCQGRTTRWGIAWTYSHEVLLCMVPVYGNRNKRKNPMFKPKDRITIEAGLERLVAILSELPAATVSGKALNGDFGLFMMEADRNSWSKQKHKKSVESHSDREGSELQNEVQLDEEDEQQVPVSMAKPCTAISKSVESIVPILKTMVTIRKEFNEHQRQAAILVELHYIAGAAGVDGAHQLLQFITNKWS